MNPKPRAKTMCLLLLVVLCLCSLAAAQDGSKSIKSEEYLAKRPAEIQGGRTSASANVAGKRQRGNKNNSGRREPGKTTKPSEPAPSFVYIVDKDFPEGPPPRNYEYVRLGMTIWRLSPTQCPIPDCPLPKASDSSKGLVDTATRINDNVPLNNGERVRLGLESLAQSGYVYIVDREQFDDGSMGEAFLIFPTRKIDDGENRMHPGQQIHLPRAGGCFCVKSRNSQKLLVADVLTVILSRTPLLRAEEIGTDAIPVPISLISFVERADKERTFRGLLSGGSGLAQTTQEQSAGAKGLFDTASVLTQNDLPPQTLYQSLVPIGKVAIFNFSLRYGTAAKKASQNNRNELKSVATVSTPETDGQQLRSELATPKPVNFFRLDTQNRKTGSQPKIAPCP